MNGLARFGRQLLLALASLPALGALPAQTRDERTAAVGMRAHTEQVVLPGSELQVAPADHGAPLVLRILAVWPHGEHFRYDFEWAGLEPGTYDLTKYLVRKNGSSLDGLAPVEVTVTSVLAKGKVEPSELEPVAPERLDGYRTQQVIAAVVWGVGLLLILFVGRRWRRPSVAVVEKPTLADRLRPLVEAVAAGRADDAAKAELERVLVAFWRARLDLRTTKAAAAIVAIRQHPEAGALLHKLEAWLHMPVPPASLDLQALLQPYRAVSADAFEPLAAGQETADVR